MRDEEEDQSTSQDENPPIEGVPVRRSPQTPFADGYQGKETRRQQEYAAIAVAENLQDSARDGAYIAQRVGDEVRHEQLLRSIDHREVENRDIAVIAGGFLNDGISRGRRGKSHERDDAAARNGWLRYQQRKAETTLGSAA